jgi:hypothetical protein
VSKVIDVPSAAVTVASIPSTTTLTSAGLFPRFVPARVMVSAPAATP